MPSRMDRTISMCKSSLFHWPTLIERDAEKSNNSIVGKGNHSAHHVQKIKPRVEKVCRSLGLQYATEENAGRVYVNLTGAPADMPPSGHHQQPSSHHQYPGQQHHQNQNQQQDDTVEKVVNALLPRVMRKLEKACCVVM